MNTTSQKTLWALWAFSLVAMVLSFIGIQGNETDRLLQHIPTSLALIGFAYAIYKQTFSFKSMVLLFVFLWIHILGARYLYSYVPYDDWFRALFGTGLNELMGWTRNHYDRFVHTSYGVCCGLVACEFFYKKMGLTRKQSIYFAVEFIMASSMLYELIEFAIAMQFPPEQAENYNGQQGDVWDAHKDMLVATIGAIVSLALGTKWLLNTKNK